MAKLLPVVVQKWDLK